MKSGLVFLALLFPAFSFADCVKVQELDGQKHFRCSFPGVMKSVDVLDLHGRYDKTAYYHGLFLRNEIEDGVLNGIRTKTNRAFADVPQKDLPRLLAIKECVIDKYKKSSSTEFREGLRRMHQGMVKAGSRVTLSEFENLNYMVEFSGFADTLQKDLEENPSKAKKTVLGLCGGKLVLNGIENGFRKLVSGLQGLKLGCTGVASSATHSKDGALVLGRNFDTGLLGYFEKHPLILIQENNGIKVTGLASAGLHFAGGISGFNSAGLTASLHELRTEGVKAKQDRGGTDIMPALLHKVLSEAHTIDEAVAMVKKARGFGAWTIFIADSKTDEIASIEISGDDVAVARRNQHQFMAQSNHFFAPATARDGYEYSMNKTLESHARMNLVTRELSENAGQVDAHWVMNMLSGHEDFYVGMRSFGRTTTKVYTAATHVMVPARQEFWMSLKETYPTNLSSFVGLRLSNGPSPIELVGVTHSSRMPGLDSWYKSLGSYVGAWQRAQEDNGSLIGADILLDYLGRAQDQALEDGVYEFPYHFMAVRVMLEKSALLIQAKQLLPARDLIEASIDKLKEIRVRTTSLHPYELLQLNLWAVRAMELNEFTGIRLPEDYGDFRAQTLSDIAEFRLKYPRQTELTKLQNSLRKKINSQEILNIPLHFETVE